VTIIFDEGTATAGGLHDGFGTVFNARPPRVNVATGAIQAGRLSVEVIIHGAAASGLAGRDDADSQSIQYSRSGGVGIG